MQFSIFFSVFGRAVDAGDVGVRVWRKWQLTEGVVAGFATVRRAGRRFGTTRRCCIDSWCIITDRRSRWVFFVRCSPSCCLSSWDCVYLATERGTNGLRDALRDAVAATKAAGAERRRLGRCDAKPVRSRRVGEPDEWCVPGVRRPTWRVPCATAPRRRRPRRDTLNDE